MLLSLLPFAIGMVASPAYATPLVDLGGQGQISYKVKRFYWARLGGAAPASLLAVGANAHQAADTVVLRPGPAVTNNVGTTNPVGLVNTQAVVNGAPNAVPEPSTGALLLSGLGGLVAWCRYRQQA